MVRKQFPRKSKRFDWETHKGWVIGYADGASSAIRYAVALTKVCQETGDAAPVVYSKIGGALSFPHLEYKTARWESSLAKVTQDIRGLPVGVRPPTPETRRNSDYHTDGEFSMRRYRRRGVRVHIEPYEVVEEELFLEQGAGSRRGVSVQQYVENNHVWIVPPKVTDIILTGEPLTMHHISSVIRNP